MAEGAISGEVDVTPREDAGRNADVSWRAVAGAFVEGLLHPSLPAFLGCLTVCGACFLGSVCLLTPEILGRCGTGCLAAHSTDSYGYLSSQLLALHEAESLPESVTLIGASAMRESLDLALLAAELKRLTGQDINVLPLLCEGLTDWEMAAITCELGTRQRGAVILEVSPGHFSRALDWVESLARSPRILFPGTCLEEELRLCGAEIPERRGNLFLDNHRFFFSRPGLLLNLVSGPREIRYNLAQTWRQIEGEARDAAILQRMDAVASYEELHAMHLDVYRSMLGHVDAPGTALVLLETPRNPLLVHAYAEDPNHTRIWDAYQREIDILAADFGAAYWNLNGDAGFSPDEFVDSAHLQDWAAVRRYTEILAVRIAELWDDGHAGATP